MKGLYTFIVVIGLFLTGLCNTAQAIDFNLKGAFVYSFDYISGGNFMSKTRTGRNVRGQQWAGIHQHRDSFDVVERINLQFEATASEYLSATVFLEIGDIRSGQASSGGALGADSTAVIKVRHAYLDWLVPNSSLTLRMGLQSIRLPGFALDSPVFDDDAAAIVASYAVNENVSITAFWMRPFNDNFNGTDEYVENFMDNFDLGGVLVPMTFKNLKMTPWLMAGAFGPNMYAPYGVNSATNAMTVKFPPIVQGIDNFQVKDGLFPAVFSSRRPLASLYPDEYSTVFWAGFTAQVTTLKPWNFVFDAIYGSVSTQYEDLNRAGWFGMFLAEYRMKWGTPGLYIWYFSGDDDNPNNGSERLPYIATTNNYANSLSSFGYRGSVTMGGGKGVLGTNPTGTWGIGARIKNMSFVENLSHIFRVNYFRGTNHPQMAAYITGRDLSDDAGRAVYRNNTDFNSFGTYLTTKDAGIEINFDTRYKLTENLSVIFEAAYIHLWLDEGTWGKYQNLAGSTLHYKDAWKTSLHFIYTF